MTSKDIANNMRNASFSIVKIPFMQKGPKTYNWRNVDFLPEQFYDNDNIGIKTGSGHGKGVIAIDVDYWGADVVQDVLAMCERMLGQSPTRVGAPPKALKVYRTAEQFSKKIRTLRPSGNAPDGKKEQIEVLADGQQFVAHGIHPDTRQAYMWTNFVPWVDGRTVDSLTLITEQQLEAFLDAVADKYGIPSGRPRVVREGQDRRLSDRAIWKVLDAIDPSCDYNQWVRVLMGLHSLGEYTLAHAIEWSSRGTNYDGEQSVIGKWSTFDANTNNGVTWRSIIAMANDELTADFNWEDFIFLSNQDKIYRTSDKTVISKSAFNTAYGRYVPLVQIGQRLTRPKADVYLADTIECDVAWDRMYYPGHDEVFEHAGLTWVNSYQTPPNPGVGIKASDGQFIEDHLKKLLPNDWKIALQWLGYVVQNPGKRVRWALVIKGAEGDGKSTIGEMLRKAIGHRNVRAANPDDIYSRFNGYAEGAQVVVMEELRAVGHSKHDVLNRLKPLITNDTVVVDEKNEKPREVVNVSSYLCLTNHEDAIPGAAEGRRYYVAFTSCEDIEDVKKKMGGKDYFDALYAKIKSCGPAMLKFLQEVDLSSFSPDTLPEGGGSGNAAMQEAARSESEASIIEMIELGEYAGVNENFILTKIVSQVLQLKTHTLSSALKRLGYKKAKVLKVGDGVTRVYVNKNIPLDDEDAILRLVKKELGNLVEASAGKQMKCS